MVKWTTEFLAAGILAGVIATAATAAGAQRAHEPGVVPDFSSNLAGWVANEQDSRHGFRVNVLAAAVRASKPCPNLLTFCGF
jgi:hypothetical protein